MQTIIAAKWQEGVKMTNNEIEALAPDNARYRDALEKARGPEAERELMERLNALHPIVEEALKQLTKLTGKEAD